MWQTLWWRHHNNTGHVLLLDQRPEILLFAFDGDLLNTNVFFPA